MNLVVTNIIRETEDAVTVCFRNGGFFKKISYKPGQFMMFSFSINQQAHKRAYSFSSTPKLDKDLKITVKRIKNGLVSNFIHDHLQIGDKIEVDNPSGSFWVQPQKSLAKTYIFFAGGSGVTPIFSITRYLLQIEPKSKILLIYANQNSRSIIFLKEIEALHEKYADRFFAEHILEEDAKSDENYHMGLVTDALIVDLLEKHKIALTNSFFMICGPFGYMEAVKSILAVNGVVSSKIKVELFKRPKLIYEGKDLMSTVEIQMKGSSYQMKVPGNKSILQAALQNNILLPYSCRSGMCSTCKASCISGDIKMTEGHFLEQKEVDEGKILTCVSYPTSESIIIAI